jgi:two-component system nitrate/nitrite response regulator NarL
MRILIAEQNTLLRTSLAELIRNDRPDWVLMQAGSLPEARQCLDDNVTVLLLGADLMPPGDLTGLRLLRADFPDLKIVIRADRPDRATVLSCFRAGAHACVVSSMSAFDLILAIRCAATGEAAFASVFSELAPPPPVWHHPRYERPAQKLTCRQYDVLRQLEHGRSTKEIARRLGLSVGTIKVHLASIYRTLGARNRVEAAIKATEAGIITDM